MANYPLINDSNTKDAVNYLLSGPAGLGQNFQGFSSYNSVYVTGFYRKPYGITTSTSQIPAWYVAPITVTNAYPINVDASGETNYFTITFAAQSTPPFYIGQTVTVSGVVDSSGTGFYNDTYVVYGVVNYTSTSVTIRTSKKYVWPTYVSGGTIGTNLVATAGFVSTDCNARIKVFGASDQVFVTAQLNPTFNYTCTDAANVTIQVAINRYIGQPNTADIGSVDYVFNFDSTISQRFYTQDVSVGAGNLNFGDAIFTTVLDSPPLNYYWYIAEIYITLNSGNFVCNYVEIDGPRSLTAQVIKQ